MPALLRNIPKPPARIIRLGSRLLRPRLGPIIQTGTDGHVEAAAQGTAVTSALPTGFTSDGTQFCLMTVAFGSGGTETTITTPSGWTKIPEVTGLSTKVVVFWRFLQSGDTAPSFTLSTSRAWCSHSTTFLGVDQTNPINTSAGLDFASASSYTSSTITPSVNQCMIVACWGGKTGTDPLRQTVTIPSPWTDTVNEVWSSPYQAFQSTIATVNNNWATFEYQPQSVATSVSEAVTVANSATAQCSILALTPSGAAPTPSTAAIAHQLSQYAGYF